jgi:hypothetical protein
MKKIRDRFGFRAFTSKHDDEMNYLSKLRNCLPHNYGKVDSKLPKAPLSLREGEKLSLGMPDVNSAINALRKLAYEIDKEFERI